MGRPRRPTLLTIPHQRTHRQENSRADTLCRGLSAADQNSASPPARQLCHEIAWCRGSGAPLRAESMSISDHFLCAQGDHSWLRQSLPIPERWVRYRSLAKRLNPPAIVRCNFCGKVTEWILG